jgi:hypothetical protein
MQTHSDLIVSLPVTKTQLAVALVVLVVVLIAFIVFARRRQGQ